MSSCIFITSLKRNVRGSAQYILITIFILTVVDSVEADNDWPTYDHPVFRGYKCYMCPPGFYKVNECVASRHNRPEWPECRRCPSTQFSQRWNTDARCWDHDVCEKNHEEIYNGATTGPTKCACSAKTLEDAKGICVSGITSSEHDDELKKLSRTFQAKLDASKNPISSCPLCPTQPGCPTQLPQDCPTCSCQSVEGPSAFLLVLVGVVVGIVISGVPFVIFLRKTWRKKEHSSPSTDYSQKKHTEGTETHQNQLSTTATQGTQTERTQTDQNQLSTTATQGTQTEKQTDVARPAQDANPRNSRIDEVKLQIDDPVNTEPVKHMEVVLPVKGEAVPDGHPEEAVPQCRRPVVAAGQREEERDYMDEALRIIEISVTKIEDVDDIMRHVFGFTAKECEVAVNANNSKPIPSLRYGFKKWREEKSENANIATLLASLRAFKKNSIADKILDTLNITEERETTKEKEDQLDYVIRICEMKIIVNTGVKEFFRTHLALDDRLVDTLYQNRKTFVRKGLMAWKDRNTKENATVRKLIQHFIDADMRSYADIIWKELGKKYLDFPTTGAESSSREEFGGADAKALPPELSSVTGTEAEQMPAHLASSESPIPSTSGYGEAGANSRRVDTAPQAWPTRSRVHSDRPSGDTVHMENERVGPVREHPDATALPAPTGNELWDDCERANYEGKRKGPSIHPFVEMDNVESDPSEKDKSANRKSSDEVLQTANGYLPTSKFSKETLPTPQVMNGNCGTCGKTKGKSQKTETNNVPYASTV